MTNLQQAQQLAELALKSSRDGDFKTAADQYRKAVEQAPDNAQLQFNLASMLRINGDLKQAAEHFSRALELNPDDAEAWYFRSSIQRATPQKNRIQDLKKRLSQTSEASRLEPRLAVHLWYALGKEYEDLEQWQDAKSAIDQGAAIRRQHMDYNIEQDCQIIQRISQVFDPAYFSATGDEHADASAIINTAMSAQAKPLFILGMPRAGSTLLERIISCAPGVSIAGELNDFSIATTEVIKQAAISGKLKPYLTGARVSKTQLVELSAKVPAQNIARRYLERTASFHTEGSYFIDKLPLNYLNIGLIKKAFGDKARIIHIQRQRDDHIWGIYKHLFNNVYPFSYNLDELNRYYDSYEALMAHWNTLLPDYICNVRYEDLVRTPEATCARIFEFLGLEWKSDYLNFHAVNTAPSATGSAAQVREKLHDRNIGRAQHIFRADN